MSRFPHFPHVRGAILKARRDSSLESINHAVEIKVRAERRLGELLRDGDKAKGGQPHQKKQNPTGNALLPVEPTLEEQGISKMQSSRFQKLAAVDEKDFEQHIAIGPHGSPSNTPFLPCTRSLRGVWARGRGLALGGAGRVSVGYLRSP